MRRLLQYLEDLLWPRGLQCLCCERLTGGGLLCSTCADQLAQLRIPFEEGPVQSVWPYMECPGKLVRCLKDDCVADAALLLADGIADVIRQMELPEGTVLTWISMPKGRQRARGIDHGRQICEAVSQRTGMPAIQLLHRAEGGRPQRRLNGKQRLQNLKGRFTCVSDPPASVLLIDDVMTTGATIGTCTEVLQKGGVRMVYAVTATRVT